MHGLSWKIHVCNKNAAGCGDTTPVLSAGTNPKLQWPLWEKRHLLFGHNPNYKVAWWAETKYCPCCWQQDVIWSLNNWNLFVSKQDLFTDIITMCQCYCQSWTMKFQQKWISFFKKHAKDMVKAHSRERRWCHVLSQLFSKEEKVNDTTLEM